jgi:hypothetical protein
MKNRRSSEVAREAERAAAVVGLGGAAGSSSGTTGTEAATGRDATGIGNGQGGEAVGLSVKSKAGG